MSDAIEAALNTMFHRSAKKELPLAWDSVRAEMRIVIATWCEAEADKQAGLGWNHYAEDLRESAAALREGRS